MFESLKKKSFGDRLKDTGYLLKNSFKVIGKDKDILTPTYHMIFMGIFISIIIIFVLLSYMFPKYELFSTIGLIVSVFVLIPFTIFYNTRQKADQSWIVYNTITGKDTDYHGAHSHNRQHAGKIRLIAFIEILIKFATASKNRRGGILRMILNLFLKALEEVWDLLSHYMLPATVIEGKSITQIVPELKAMKNNVPAALVGVFGIDFVGHVINLIIYPIYLLLMAGAILLGWVLAKSSMFSVVTISGYSIALWPIVIVILIIGIAGTIIKYMVESTKVIYFTIFYTTLTRPQAITKDMRDELTHYLLMDDNATIPKNQSTVDQNVQGLAQYIKNYTGRGYDQKQIVDFLISKGYKKTQIDKALVLANK